MTKQETFDTVAAHLLKQGKRSMSGPRTCLYRGPDGMKCAVGCLIPDDLYRSSLEGIAVVDILSDEVTTEVGRLMKSLGHDLTLCGELQWLHDQIEPDLWEGHLKVLASRLGIEFRESLYRQQQPTKGDQQ